MDLLKTHAPAAEKVLGRLLEIGKGKIGGAGDGGLSVETEALLDTEGLVHARGGNGNTVEAEFVSKDNRSDLGLEAFAMWPTEIEIMVPEDWKAGDKIPAQGPHGRIYFELPEECKPGTSLRYRLRPAPELRIEVPPGAFPGASLTFERPDGTRISITVPPGKRPGEHFEVTPPALMVLVPEEAHPGDTVVFSVGPQGGQGGSQAPRQWFRAEVPKELQLGKYFAARLPPPETQGMPKGPGSPKKEGRPQDTKEETQQILVSNSDSDQPCE